MLEKDEQIAKKFQCENADVRFFFFFFLEVEGEDDFKAAFFFARHRKLCEKFFKSSVHVSI